MAATINKLMGDYLCFRCLHKWNNPNFLGSRSNMLGNQFFLKHKPPNCVQLQGPVAQPPTSGCCQSRIIGVFKASP